MKLILIVMALLLLPFGLKADTFYEMADDSVSLDWISFDTTHLMVDIADMSDYTISAASIGWGSPKPDSTTHYVIGQDTIITGPRIECDTVGEEHYTVRDTTITSYSFICDTIYTVTFRPKWAPLVTVKLDSILYRRLIEILNN